ncbi:Palmitoyl-acyl carrier protein thioesterase, chloroplastic [Capsicum annuum]|uniref:palmitoyl-acyl carrier protein thioesterase, chloroplastic isoform X1 n=1 Tax=Capsicum annuum TaxID=4072 RepID=UPI001FB13A33|nr:palmitoyl-acyl carrier protein thioesterase, chloroplastic isoform X1 [Capsicum annuum]KAF3626470.1 Palmitoyl-acyl carrier protein thioesterase, chloroplastic [Capsicum annuum]KAF3647192.1 Palmitoyl-acyl carrier protein thioesterase, chloroplastic [Capsicum annuum]
MSLMIRDLSSLHYTDNFWKTEKHVKECRSLKFDCNAKKKWRAITASADSSGSRSIDTINGKKINGVHVEGHSQSGQRGNVVESGSSSSPKHSYMLGNFVEDKVVYRQSFVIRSYEIGPDKTATMETIMNLLQETALNHVANSGVGSSGFGATREMSLRKLIWVVTRIHIQIEQYSSWGDVVEIDTWVDAAGKNGMRRDWIIRDSNTRKIITRATSKWVIMNIETRRLSKIPEQVKAEVRPFYINRFAIPTAQIDSEKIEKLNDETAQIISSGLAPRWSDMDANQHVNNVKYIGWILESVPINVLEDYYLMSLTLEYRRECQLSNVLQSMTTMREIATSASDKNCGLECTHLIRMEADRAEVVRARSLWQPKQ